MQSFADAFRLAFALVFSADADLIEIVGLSLRVSLTAILLACLIGLPLGAWLAISRFKGRGAMLVFINALMGLPPVVVGLLVYLNLSRAGPLGSFGLLYTPTAMIIAQTILIAPIIAALSRQVIEDLHSEYDEQFRSMKLTRGETIRALLWDGRTALITVALAGFGRAIAEVGAVIIVGGNIDHGNVKRRLAAGPRARSDLARHRVDSECAGHDPAPQIPCACPCLNQSARKT